MQRGENTFTVKNIVKGLFVVILVLSTGTASQTTEEPWKNPCGGSSAPPPGWGTPVDTASPSEILESVAIQLEESVLNAKTLQNLSVALIIGNLELADRLKVYPVEGLPYIMENETVGPLADAIKLNYERLSTVMVFLMQIVYEERTSDIPHEFIVNGLDDTLTLIKNILCQKQNLLSNLGEQINYISSDVMPPKFKITRNTADRHVRDYAVISKLEDLFKVMEKQVDTLRQQL